MKRPGAEDSKSRSVSRRPGATCQFLRGVQLPLDGRGPISGRYSETDSGIPLGEELREVFGSGHSLRLSVKSHECIGMVEFGDGEITPLEPQLVRVLRVDSSTGHLARTL